MNLRKILLWDVSRSQPIYYLVPLATAAVFFVAYFLESPRTDIVVRGVAADSYIVSFDHAFGESAEDDQRLISAAEEVKARRGLDTTTPLYADGRIVAVMVSRGRDDARE